MCEPIEVSSVIKNITGETPAFTRLMGLENKYIAPFNLIMPAGKDYITYNNTNLQGELEGDENIVNFSWHNPADVEMYHNLPGDIISPPPQQATCGSCWAWATSMAVGDRVAIATGVNPKVGPSYLIGCSLSGGQCDQQNDGCNGGEIINALNDMANNAGAVPETCWSYNWCKKDPICNVLGYILPENFKCSKLNRIANKALDFNANKNRCITSSDKFTIYKVVPESMRYLYSAAQIKRALFDKGPVPIGMYVYGDFMAGSFLDNWASTGGIYIHLDTSLVKGKFVTVNGDPIAYKYGTGEHMNEKMGAHAMTIVGWGVQTIKNFLPISNPGKATIDIPFWWVRNSWGALWANKGYCKIAMTNTQYKINNLIGIEPNGQFGMPQGCACDFDIIVPTSRNSSDNYIEHLALPNNVNSVVGDKPLMFYLIISGIILIVLYVLCLIYTISCL